ncbi:hypothetical protein C1H76_2440 [Elsinoe australis]|uniref:Uncharacterized protein n=1 Tax=Elsinoe australis TaxID=40998 RepID=A0A2P8A449_9PEZI|nr:hypothetical protein B9Z65_2621 [Elsinoe australis]TKX25210.1 hypothetical protein C1H76_2440 [Elsinoe australis]
MSAPSPERTSYDTSRRRSSSGMFGNLAGYKRDPQNPMYAQRRTSLSEQSTQKPGFIGTMFNKYVRQASPWDK